MLPTLHRLLVLLIVLFGARTSYGDTWNVQSYIYSGGVYYSHLHAVGSPSFMLGFREYHYSTDAAGLTIMPYSDIQRKPQLGDRLHSCTQIYLGPSSFSIPMHPLPSLLVGVTAIFVILFSASFSLKFLRRKRYETQVA